MKKNRIRRRVSRRDASGEFHREWCGEQDEYNLEHLNALRERALAADVTQAEDRLFNRLKGSRAQSWRGTERASKSRGG